MFALALLAKAATSTMVAGSPAEKAAARAASPAQKAKAAAAAKVAKAKVAKEQQKLVVAAAAIEKEIAAEKVKAATVPPVFGAPDQVVTKEIADAKVNADVETAPPVLGALDQAVTEAPPAGLGAPGPVGTSATPRTSPLRAVSTAGDGEEKTAKKRRRHSGGDASEGGVKNRRRRRRSSRQDEARHMCQG
jgi:hypothetical protein